MTPPGHRLRQIAARVCDRTTMATVIDPAIADLQHEAEVTRRAGCVQTRLPLRRYLVLWHVLAYGIAHSVIRRTAAGFTAERDLLTQAVQAGFAGSLSLTVLLTLPDWLSTPSQAAASNHGLMFLCLLPQAAAIGIPIGASCGIAFAARSRPFTIGVIAPLTVVALLASALTAAILEWLVPETNQAFRTLAFGGQPVRGLHELGLTALARRTDPAGVLALQVRLSLVASSFMLTGPGLVMMRAFRRGWAALLFGLVGLAAYFICAWTLARSLLVHAPVLAAWSPTLLLAAAATAVLAARPLRDLQRRP